MKRLFYIITIICLPLIAYFMYDNYRSHHPESIYAYQSVAGIDATYHNPDVLLRYHQLCEEIGAYGRHCWRDEGIDVLREDNTDSEAGPLIQRYQSLIATARYLEGKLTQSQKWKAQGYNNEQIILAESGRSSEGEEKLPVEVIPDIGPLARLGDKSPLVLAVQQKLLSKGYKIEPDGIFRSETENAIKYFQADQALVVHGLLDLPTFLKLWQ